MIMSVIPERPKSADSADRRLKEYYNEIDYTGSSMYGDILKKKFKKMLSLKAKELGADVDELVLDEHRNQNTEAIADLLRNAAGQPNPELDRIAALIKSEAERIFEEAIANRQDLTAQEVA